MAKVLHGDAGGNQLNVSENNAQAYGLKGNDTIVSDDKSNVLLVGGGGDDSLIVMGGEATLSGGDGADVFELNYSAEKKLSAVIEDLQPSEDKIVVNFDGSTAPQLSAQSISGGDVVLQDGDGLFKVTLKSVRDNDYFDDEASEQAWDVLELTNQARENANASLEASASLSPLTMSQGLMTGAQTRAEEIKILGEGDVLENHDRPDADGNPDPKNPYFKVPVYGNLTLEEKYHDYGENLDGGAETPEKVLKDWMGSQHHRENILDESIVDKENNPHKLKSRKLGVGYIEDHSDPNEYYWTQLFADSLRNDISGNFETVTAEELLTTTASIEPNSVSKFIAGTENPDTIPNGNYGVTIDALGGNDSINNSGLNVSISGGADDDTILSSGSFATIAGNAGNDLVSLSSDAKEILIEYALGDGNDTISGLNSTDTVSISGNVEFTPETVNNDIVVGVGSDSITLLGAVSSGVKIEGVRSKLILGTENDDYLENTVAAASILAKGGNDTIDNSGANVSIYSGTGDDSVYNSGSNVLFFYESGNDTIRGFDETSTLKIAGGSLSSVTVGNDLILLGSDGTDSIKILGAASLSPINIVDADDNAVEIGDAKNIVLTEGNDFYINRVDGATIRALGGDDTIDNRGYYSTINAGAGNDSINNSGNWISIFDGAGNDFITNSGENILFYYESGNDTIDGFNDSNMNNSNRLNIGYYSYNSITNNQDILINIISGFVTIGSITLKDCPSVQAGNILTSNVPSSERGENISNSTSSTLITGTAGYDTIENTGDNVTINALAGNDTVDNGVYDSPDVATNVSIIGDAGNDFITNYGNSVTIDGGEGIDTISSSGVNSSIDGGAGNDFITASSAGAILNGGAGDDMIGNSGSNSSINGGAGDDNIGNTDGDNSEIICGAGNDSVTNSQSSSVTIDAGDGDDFIHNWNGSNISIVSGSGNDYIYNIGGSNISIDTGAGNDSIFNNGGNNVSIDSGTGNDSIVNYSGSNVSILGGLGNDLISLGADTQNNLIQYNVGDGDDTIYGLDKTDKLQLGDGHVKYSTVASGNDVLVKVGDNTITLKDFKEKPENIIIGESGTSGGSGSGGGSGGGTSSSGSGGSSGQSGGNTSGGTSASANSNSDASGGQSASGSSGTSATSDGNGSSGRGNSSSTATAGTSITNPITLPENLSTTSNRQSSSTNSNPFNTSVTTTQGTYSGTKMSPLDRVYTGGNRIIQHYGSWRKITFDEIYRGAHFDGAGNFVVESSTGHLVFENATDKVINLKDAAGNDFIKAHMSSSAGTVDGRIYSGYQILNGSLGEDLIFAGADGSQLWGNADTAADTLVGGDGSDIFVGGKNEGSDTFQNASAADVINLNDTSLSDIVSTNTRDGALVISFNTGNTLTVQSTEALSANIIFSDGATRRFNHSTNSWQTA